MISSRLRSAALCAAIAAASFSAIAQLPAALTTDPPIDKTAPARMDAFQIPSHGEKLNAIAYLAAGAGPHPAVILLHGFPGNEKNLDLAQAIRRAGWDVLFFNYRGSWGSPGTFSFAHAIEDTQTAVAYLREPANATRLRVDPKRIVVIGHSMGGFMAAYAGTHDPAILATGMISAANFFDWSKAGQQPGDDKGNVTRLAARLEEEDILPLAGCTGESLAAEMIAHSKEWNYRDYTAMFGQRPLLIVNSDDGLAPMSEPLVPMLQGIGNTHVTLLHLPTDHSYSDHRVALETAVLNWLATLQ
jgi:uncharacterized protein